MKRTASKAFQNESSMKIGIIGSGEMGRCLATKFTKLGHTVSIANSRGPASLKQFTGDISQVPPIHSAIKQEGKRVYLLARKGADIKLQPRKVSIHKFEIINIKLPLISFRVVCTTGTYIRSLAYDFGAALGCGAYLSSLRRTRIGSFTVGESVSPDDFAEQLKLIMSGQKG